ncbi:tetratricopeptide repeat protein [Nostoc sp. FACHB-152]|uniref:serine/threonine-protein kinase n=1 Tax=unclassified Nostoc TaxID=2593658 RepID=UPI0016899DE7|nr:MULTISPECIES: serine/threonine-protein kinase [unclassified Nostoc]MBD2449255.1 tetratricopeptide repeat protein [Nostoc sp. FACHB-152]MBD2470467.1 tetratricopeptide repeat protein [Nostoc sp. FACHB-145]
MNGQLLDGRYEIVQVLGEGAFGKTFLAKDLKRPGHPECVVKQLIYSSNDTQALEAVRRLFKAEAETLERLGQHDRIPTLLAEFEYNHEFYLVQQFIHGHTLNQEILPNQPWTEEQILKLLTDILPILAFVHGQGVIHRDIKPANLMRRTSDGNLVLIDFGAVKEIDSKISQIQSDPSVAIGTAAYMPVEQFQGFPKFNSDIYALGMICIQALLGVTSNQLTKLIGNSITNTNQTPWRKQANISPALADVIEKMVVFDWRHRYQSAVEVLHDISEIIQQSENLTPEPVLSSQNIVVPKTKPALPIKLPLLLGIAGLIMAGGIGFIVYNQLPQTKAIGFFQQGLKKLDEKDKQGAIQALTEAINIYPEYAEAYYQRANAQFQSGNYQQAVEDATKSIELKSNYAEAFTRRCAAHVLLQAPQKAEEDCNKAIDINPKYGDAYLNRANARRNLGNKNGALNDLSELINIALSDPQAYINRGVLYIEQFKDYDKAIADFNQALQLASNKPEIAAVAYDGRGNALAAQQKLNAALDDFNKAIENKKDFAQAYFNRGLIHVQLDNKQQAIEDFQRADTLCSQQGLTNCSKLAQSAIEQLQEQ